MVCSLIGTDEADGVAWHLEGPPWDFVALEEDLGTRIPGMAIQHNVPGKRKGSHLPVRDASEGVALPSSFVFRAFLGARPSQGRILFGGRLRSSTSRWDIPVNGLKGRSLLSLRSGLVLFVITGLPDVAICG
jgi:hypothetical protein